MQEQATLTRPERLDRLPFTRWHGRLVVGSGIGWALDAMDVGLISFVIAALRVQWELSSGQMSWIASIGFVGMALGASLGGLLADRIGRRQVFALTLLVYGLATGASALAWSVGSLMALRFLVGLGLGAELPVASTLVSEFAPARIRGRLVVLLEAFWAVGWVLAAVIGYTVVQASDDGWRWGLLIGAVPALYAIVVRRGLPESVRFLERAGRVAEAERVVREFEESAAGAPARGRSTAEARAANDEAVAGDGTARGSAPSDAPSTSGSGDQEPPAGPAGLWSRPMRRRTTAAWVVWFAVNFAYYGAFIWLPSILVASGYSLVQSFGYTLVITLAQLPGYAVAAVLIETWGRRATLATFLVGSAVSAGLFGWAGGTTGVLVAGMLLSFFNLGAWGALYAVTPEIYPTSLRGTGSGWAAGFGRIASILAPLAVPPLLAAGGKELTFAAFAAAFVVAAVAALGLPELRGRALQEDG
ncbi:MFS transporter [Actinotalea ferrariae]|uniref:MFS transporter n=1 Tax=Actinotalea ferrariae TaxID=1386098 RepID=UPI001C8CEEA2|nr:MFS transporter [Actinotalea ferrariae]MBX9245367.1 MFS transporter [Actinotalea ferrariae]